MSAIRNQEYAAVVDRERPLIEATAYLLTGDQVQAERVVQLVFAELYWRLPRVQHPQIEALRAVVQTARRPVQLPWEPRERVELIDGQPLLPPPSRSLPTFGCSRTSSELPSSWTLCGTTAVQIAKVLERPVGHVPFGPEGRAALAAEHPERTTDGHSPRAQRDPTMRERHDGAEDMVHGRWLSRRRWIQRGRGFVAVVLIVVAVVRSTPGTSRFRKPHQRCPSTPSR